MLALGPLRDVAHALVADATAEHQLAVVAFGTLLEGTEHHGVREAVQYLMARVTLSSKRGIHT